MYSVRLPRHDVRAMRQHGVGAPATMRWSVWAIGVALAVAIACVVRRLVDGRMPVGPGAATLALGASFIVAVYVSRFFAADADPQELRGGLVRIGRCGVCAYDVRGLAPEADGCVVCPECGAAWKPTAREAQTSTMRAP